MKAAVHTKYGSPEVVKIKDVPKPIPKGKEILVKVIASTVNRTDSGFRSAEYFVSRFWSGLFRPKNQILGCEFAGTIEETGAKVTRFKKGDMVFGYNDESFGGHAEFLTIVENKSVETIPNNLTFDQAAPMLEGAHYALCNIRASKIKSGQNAMVYGATGAIGSAAVQLLTYYGISVTAVCNTKNVDLVKTLGAKAVIDYQTQDFTQMKEKFHLIFDAVGKSSFKKCKTLLTPQGIYISTELGTNAENIFLALVTPIFRGKKVVFPIPSMNQNDLIFLKHLAEKGKYRPVIDRTYRLEQIKEAYQYVETGQKTGNVLLKIIDPTS